MPNRTAIEEALSDPENFELRLEGGKATLIDHRPESVRIEEEARFEDWLRQPENGARWDKAIQDAKDNLKPDA
jgi:hypothetical protein